MLVLFLIIGRWLSHSGVRLMDDAETPQPGWKRPHWFKRQWNRLIFLKWRLEGYDGTSEPNEEMMRWLWL